MNKKQHILKHKQLFFNRTVCDKEDLMILFPLKFKLSWHKQQMMYAICHTLLFQQDCFLMKMINQQLFITVKYKDITISMWTLFAALTLL